MASSQRMNGASTDAKASLVERLVQKILGIEVASVPDYDRLQIRASDRVQGRIDKNNAPAFMVERYAMQMGEFQFPPILLTSDHIIVDGNTRNKAYGKRNERHIAVQVIPIHWDTADHATKEKILFLSQVINNMNGLPLDKE